MSVPTSSSRQALGLRQSAEVRLREGSASDELMWTTGGEALACLHKLATDPKSAPDALKLLHELQVFQVEIDMQHEQLERSRAELAEQFSQYFELYERVAVGLLMLDADGTITLANPRAASLLGAEAESLSGRKLDRYFSVASRAALTAALAELGEDSAEVGCRVRTVKANDAGDELCLTATRSRDGHGRMVALAEAVPR